MPIEVSIFENLHSIVGRSALLDWFVVFLGNYSAYLLVALALYWVWREKNWRRRFYYFAFVALAVILASGIITPVIRAVHQRPRPFELLNFTPLIGHETVSSIPSGHATFFFAIAFAFYFAGWRRRGAYFAAAAMVMGIARVVGGAHWPLDIVAGILVGLISAFVVKWLLPTRPR
jgi:undecaprenyl-diphosphatase